jgi:hypothetical protein
VKLRRPIAFETIERSRAVRPEEIRTQLGKERPTAHDMVVHFTLVRQLVAYEKREDEDSKHGGLLRARKRTGWELCLLEQYRE